MRFCSYIKYFLLYSWFYWIHPCFFFFLFVITYLRKRFLFSPSYSFVVVFIVLIIRVIASVCLFLCFVLIWFRCFSSSSASPLEHLYFSHFFVLYTYFHFCCVFLNLLCDLFSYICLLSQFVFAIWLTLHPSWSSIIIMIMIIILGYDRPTICHSCDLYTLMCHANDLYNCRQQYVIFLENVTVATDLTVMSNEGCIISQRYTNSNYL